MDHEELQALIVRLRLGTSASELHGSLTGYLAGGGAVGGDALLGVLELDGEAVEPTAARTRRRRGGMVPRLSRRLRPGRRRRPGVAVGRGAGGTARPGHDRRLLVRFRQRERGRGRADRGARIRAHGGDAAVRRVRRARWRWREHRALNAPTASLAGLAIAAEEFARRRRQLMQMAGPDAVLLVAAAPERMRNADAAWPYRQNSDFHYLAGFPEPDAVLALLPGRAHGEAVLFCRER